jgi:hypothetical protein
VLLPSKHRLDELRRAAEAPAPAAPAAPEAVPAAVPAQPAPGQPAPAQPVLLHGFEAIPVALCSCSPVVNPPRQPIGVILTR